MSFLLTPGVLQQQANRAGGKQYALEFDGEDDYVDLGNAELLSSNLFTIELFLKPKDALDYSRIFIQGEDSSNNIFQLYFYNSMINCVINSNNPITGTAIENNKFQKFAWVNNKGEHHVFLEGEQAPSNSGGRNLISPGKTRIANRGDNASYFSGAIKGIRCWDIALSEQQIKDNLNKTLIGNEDGLVYCPDFSKGSGDTLPDKTQYENHGTIYGANWIEL